LPPADVPAATAATRAILVSIDALSEERFRASLDAAAVPALTSYFADAACAAYATPAFPSLTASSHAALWTGAFGDVTGATGNWQPQLPREHHGLDSMVSGFSSEVLRAEPIWITAARQGVSVVGHHVTQGPGAPGYRPVTGERDAWLRQRLAESERVLAGEDVEVLNGYNRMIAPHRVLHQDTLPPRPARGWRNLPAGEAVPPLEMAWTVETDTVFALFHGVRGYDRVRIARERDFARGVTALAAPPESEPLRGRELARHFSDAIEIPVEGGRVFLRVRLFELAPDGSRYLLFVPSLQVAEANRAEVQVSYEDAVRGWVGNAATRNWSRGELGVPLQDGGDGTAEARYLETAELVTRQFMRGAEWAWLQRQPRLLVDYFPLGDEVDHAMYGYVSTEWPEHSPELARGIGAVRQRVWEMVDLRIEQLRRFADADPGTALVVSGDHGMRATWRVFRPNVALREAGLLATDAEGRIDLARTRALSPNGYWVMANRAAWRGGTVPPAEEAQVLAAAERALLAVRDAAGAPVVTRIFRAPEHPELGLGGPTGGDLYYGTAAGVRWTSSLNGPAVGSGDIDTGHGFPSTDPDMRTVLCAVTQSLPPGRSMPARVIDAAPTVAEWLGIDPPRDAVGRSILPELRGRR
jgi:hypothetical protein